MRIYVGVFSGLLLASSALAQNTERPGALQPVADPASGTLVSPLTPEETKLLNQLHADNYVAIEAGKLAARTAMSKAVREFGNQILQDHVQADRDLVAMAKERGVTLAGTKTLELERFRGVKGLEFDRVFVTMMFRHHEASFQLVYSQLEAGVQTPELRSLLGKLLPILKQHRDRANQLQSNAS